MSSVNDAINFGKNNDEGKAFFAFLPPTGNQDGIAVPRMMVEGAEVFNAVLKDDIVASVIAMLPDTVQPSALHLIARYFSPLWLYHSKLDYPTDKDRAEVVSTRLKSFIGELGLLLGVFGIALHELEQS